MRASQVYEAGDYRPRQNRQATSDENLFPCHITVEPLNCGGGGAPCLPARETALSGACASVARAIHLLIATGRSPRRSSCEAQVRELLANICVDCAGTRDDLPVARIRELHRHLIFVR